MGINNFINKLSTTIPSAIKDDKIESSTHAAAHSEIDDANLENSTNGPYDNFPDFPNVEMQDDPAAMVNHHQYAEPEDYVSTIEPDSSAV